VTIKSAVFLDVKPVALIRTDVSEGRVASFIKVTRFRKLETTLEARRMVSSGMSRRVDLVKTDVSEEHSSSFIRVTRIGELGTTLALTSSVRR
jgi:hypothetical protein